MRGTCLNSRINWTLTGVSFWEFGRDHLTQSQPTRSWIHIPVRDRGSKIVILYPQQTDICRAHLRPINLDQQVTFYDGAIALNNGARHAIQLAKTNHTALHARLREVWIAQRYD
jgi:hypothetical protein